MNGWRLINSLVPPLHTQPPPHHCWQLGRVKKIKPLTCGYWREKGAGIKVWNGVGGGIIKEIWCYKRNCSLFCSQWKKKKAHVEGVWAHRVFGAGRKREGEQGGHARAGGSQAGGRRGGSKDVAPHMVCITSSFLVVKINLKPFSPPPHPSSIDK